MTPIIEWIQHALQSQMGMLRQVAKRELPH